MMATDPNSGKEAPIFHPRNDVWTEHFQWKNNGIILEGITATGRATVSLLKLNNYFLVTARRNWVQAGWHPPT